MNSSQRRKQKRDQPHSIIIRTHGQEQYYIHDEKVNTATIWCRKHCKGRWSRETSWDQTEFKFSSHKDATVFALKWV